MSLPSEQDWSKFFAGFRARTTIDLHEYKQEQLRRRILNLFRTTQAKTLEELWQHALTRPNGVEWLIDHIAINVSELFRNPEKWVELENVVLPELLKTNPTLRIWSAGCSIGAEAHTLGCLLADKFPGNHKVLGTDIDQTALAQAESGRYSVADMKCAPEHYRKKYFIESDGQFQARPEIRKYLSFQKQNLLEGKFGTGYDLIICRNVVIYFTDAAKDQLYQKFLASLKPGGILWVGGTERIAQYQQLGFESHLPFFYKKPANRETTWRNAS